MNNVSLSIEQSTISIANQMLSMSDEVNDIVKAYFSTSATTLVSAASANDPVTVSSKLTKTKFVNGITYCQQLQNFFGNSAVAGPSDYMSSLQNLINSSSPAVAILSNDVESIGDRLKTLANLSIGLYKNSIDILSAYNSSQLSTALAGVDLSIVVFGCSTTKQKFVDGMNLIQNFKDMLAGNAVTTGDYLSIISKWTQGA